MRRTFNLLLICTVIIFSSLSTFAAEIQVDAFVNQTRIEVGQSITLTIQIKGDLGVQAPDVSLEEWRVQYYGPSTQVSIVNGKRTESISFLYSLVPLKAGDLKIPSIQINYAGKNYNTKLIEVIVDERGQGPKQSLESQLGEYVFLDIEIGKRRIYLGEEIPLTIKLYYRNDLELQNIHYPDLALDNFIYEQFPETRPSLKVYNGQYFYIIPFTTSIQPISTGKFKLGPATLEASILIPNKNKKNNSLGSFFNNDYDLTPLYLHSPAIEIEVLELPLKDQPADFDGAVGDYNFAVSITPEEVKIGEPITLKYKITGSGNFTTVSEPSIEKSDQFKYYEPQLVKDSGGEKIYEQVLIPLEKVEYIPTISFSYFDPVKERFQSLQKNILITITGDSEFSGGVSDYRELDNNEQALGENILYIKKHPDRFVLIEKSVFSVDRFLYYNLFLLSVGLLINQWLNKKNNVHKQRKEVKLKTLTMLKESEEYLQSNNHQQFYNVLYLTVQNCLKEYFKITITGISDYEADCLKKSGLDPVVVGKIKEFFQKIDEKRFAGYHSSRSDMENILKLAKTIISEINQGEVA